MDEQTYFSWIWKCVFDSIASWSCLAAGNGASNYFLFYSYMYVYIPICSLPNSLGDVPFKPLVFEFLFEMFNLEVINNPAGLPCKLIVFLLRSILSEPSFIILLVGGFFGYDCTLIWNLKHFMPRNFHDLKMYNATSTGSTSDPNSAPITHALSNHLTARCGYS